MARASGVGSWPGTSAREAVRIVRDLLGDEPGLPYVPETPGRGPGADLVGRSAGLLVEMPVDLQPSGWRLTDAPGKDLRRARAYLGEDLDEVAEAYDGWSGELKVQVAGPWTLAASIALPRGERAVHDQGAARDVAASLAEGVRLHLAELARLIPDARLVLQVDEPSLPAVLAGRLRTVSGFSQLPAVERDVAEAALAQVLSAAAGRPTVVHCCAPDVPVDLIRAAGAGGVALDVALLDAGGWAAVAAGVETGLRLWAGALPTDTEPSAEAASTRLTDGWERLGLDPALLTDVVVTPACGLAGLSARAAQRVQRAALDAAGELADRLG